MGASTEKGLSKRVNARVSNLYLFTMRNTFFFFSKITFPTLHFKKKYNGKSLWKNGAKFQRRKGQYDTLFSSGWASLSYSRQTIQDALGSVKASEKKPQSFPPRPLLSIISVLDATLSVRKLPGTTLPMNYWSWTFAEEQWSRTLENLTLQTFVLAFKQRAFRMILRGQKAFGKRRRRRRRRRRRTRGEILLQGKQGFQRLQKATDLGQKSVSLFPCFVLSVRRLLCHFKIWMVLVI